MRPLILSLGVCLGVLGAAWAQNTGGGGVGTQLPVGQTFKNFEFPVYQGALLKFTLYAVKATGITLNRAETTDLKIEVYDNGVKTTTITSPKADLYVAEQKMRTKNTVQIDRADMKATAQTCDFDLTTKKYVLRTHVKVILKHFDLTMTPAPGNVPAPAPAGAPPSSPSAPNPPPNPDPQ